MNGPVTSVDKQDGLLIGEDYRIIGDDLQWTIEHKIVPKGPKAKKTEAWVLIGYYPKLKDACESLLEHKLRTSEAKEIKSLIWLLAEAKKEIIRAIQSDPGASEGER